ncbi:MAG TPA: sigma-70 family RNA polymerase sigma factor [Gemmatimonadaceae bacterium]|nr:sigma-70 family RNA polymerase sigma factor [Gemmatimonadaceae bacterium]
MRDETDESPPGFEETFCRLFDQQFQSLFRYLQRLTGDADLANDLAQEVFVRLYQRASLPDDTRGWMGAVAHNLLRDQQRTASRRLRLVKTRTEGVSPEQPVGADEKMLADERREAVRGALDRLSARDRRMLLLRHEGYSYREIAHALGVKETSVGTLLLRATTAFHKALGESLS